MGYVFIRQNKYTVNSPLGFPGSSNGKESGCNAGDLGLISGLGRSLGEGNGTPLQYSCLDNPMDGGPWQSTAHRVTKSWTRLSDFTFTKCMAILFFAVFISSVIVVMVYSQGF